MEGSARAKKFEGFSSPFDRSRARRGASSGGSTTHVSVHVASAACVNIRVDPGCVAGDGRGVSSALSCDPARRVASFPRRGRSNLPPAGLFAGGLSGRGRTGAIGDRAVRYWIPNASHPRACSVQRYRHTYPTRYPDGRIEPEAGSDERRRASVRHREIEGSGLLGTRRSGQGATWGATARPRRAR